MRRADVETFAELAAKVGGEVAVSDWLAIDQRRIDLFADATGDHQWIHVDPARAAAETPYGGTIAHGFLTLSLIPLLLESVFTLREWRIGINYGLNRVRFLAPVPAASRIRGRFALAACDAIPAGVQVTWKATVEIEGGQRPACVAETIAQYHR